MKFLIIYSTFCNCKPFWQLSRLQHTSHPLYWSIVLMLAQASSVCHPACPRHRRAHRPEILQAQKAQTGRASWARRNESESAQSNENQKSPEARKTCNFYTHFFRLACFKHLPLVCQLTSTCVVCLGFIYKPLDLDMKPHLPSTSKIVCLFQYIGKQINKTSSTERTSSLAGVLPWNHGVSAEPLIAASSHFS